MVTHTFKVYQAENVKWQFLVFKHGEQSVIASSPVYDSKTEGNKGYDTKEEATAAAQTSKNKLEQGYK